MPDTRRSFRRSVFIPGPFCFGLRAGGRPVRLARVSGQAIGRHSAAPAPALAIVDPRFEGVDLGGDELVVLRSAMAHAGDVVDREHVVGRLRPSRFDEVLVALGFAGADDVVGAPCMMMIGRARSPSIQSAQLPLHVRGAPGWIPLLDVVVGERRAARVERLVESRHRVAQVAHERAILTLPLRLRTRPAADVVGETIAKLRGDVVQAPQGLKLSDGEGRREFRKRDSTMASPRASR